MNQLIKHTHLLPTVQFSSARSAESRDVLPGGRESLGYQRMHALPNRLRWVLFQLPDHLTAVRRESFPNNKRCYCSLCWEMQVLEAQFVLWEQRGNKALNKTRFVPSERIRSAGYQSMCLVKQKMQQTLWLEEINIASSRFLGLSF